MMTAYGEVDVAVEAMKRGAFDFLTKPVNLEKLDLLIKRGLDTKKLKKENKIYIYRLDKKFSFPGNFREITSTRESFRKSQVSRTFKSYNFVNWRHGNWERN